jgi:hypothetical protein
VLPAVIGTTLIVVGVQNALGGFLLAILNGNEAEFLRTPDWQEQEPTSQTIGAEVRHAIRR